MDENTFSKVDFGSSVWDVPKRYTDLSLINSGSFGHVCKAKDCRSDLKVAIKKLKQPFLTERNAIRTYREYELLLSMEHDNVITIIDAWTTASSASDFKDIYFVMPFIGCDLKFLMDQCVYTNDHVKIIIYQLLRGLKYIHSRKVIHRDLKPANIGIDPQNCQLKILDLGLARPVGLEMSSDVATIWYRAPEIILNMAYNNSVDMWSVGCILAELLLKEPLFKGCNDFEQLKLIMYICPPTGRCMKKIPKEVQEYIKGLPARKPVKLKDHIQTRFNSIVDQQAIELLESLLKFDPKERPSAKDALGHRYLSEYHDTKDEPTGKVVDNSFEKLNLQVNEWKVKIFDELQLLTSVLGNAF